MGATCTISSLGGSGGTGFGYGLPVVDTTAPTMVLAGTYAVDLDTLRVLEEAIEHYPGSMIIVTHDRYFLNRVATHILAFEGDGRVVFHHGDYESYKEWKLAQGEDIDDKGGTHRKFSRS